MELEKKGIGIGDREYIIIKDIADVKLISYDGVQCDIKMNFDYYMTSLLGCSILDMQFEIAEKMVKELTLPKMLLKSKMIFEGEEQSVSNLISEVLWKSYQYDKIGKIQDDEKYRKDLHNVDLESMREDIFDDFGVIFHENR